jgi:hypothetical protein
MTNLGHVYNKSKDREELNNLERQLKMNSTLLVNISRFILLLAVQIIIFNNMNFVHNPITIHTVYNTIPRQETNPPLLFASFLLANYGLIF